jgi:heat-inducible transcriptional repressor
MLNQPEFARSELMHDLLELSEGRILMKVIAPVKLSEPGVQVIIGKENKEAAIQNCSVVIGQYGLAGQATGTIAVVGPTRMPYLRTIPAVYYVSRVLSQLVAGLYGKDMSTGQQPS